MKCSQRSRQCLTTRTSPMSNPGDDAREVMAKDRRCDHHHMNGESAEGLNGKCVLCGNWVDSVAGATMKSFDKMQPGEVDKIFQACCPQCDGHVWVFTQALGTSA